MSLPKQWKNADFQVTSKDYMSFERSWRKLSKMQVLPNLSNFVNSYWHLSEMLAFLPHALTKYG